MKGRPQRENRPARQRGRVEVRAVRWFGRGVGARQCWLTAYLLRAGFSRRISDQMPLIDDSGLAIAQRFQESDLSAASSSQRLAAVRQVIQQ